MLTPRILYTDLSTYTFSTGSFGAVSGHDVLNLHDYITTNTWMGDASSLVSEHNYLVIDLGSVKDIDCIIVDNHNCDSCILGTVTIESADNSAFTINKTTEVTELEMSEKVIVSVLPSPITKRYLRIHYAGEIIENPFIGNIFVGEQMIFNTSYNFGFKRDNPKFTTTEKVTLSGIKRNVQSSSKVNIQHEIEFSFITNDVKMQFIDFIKTVKGKQIPFYFLDTDNVVRYVTSESDYTPTQVIKTHMSKINTLSMIDYAEQYTYSSAINIDLIPDDDLVTEVI